MRAGKTTSKSKDISFTQALNDPITRPEYIRRKWTYVSNIHVIKTVSRPSSAEVVDGSLRYGCYPINKEDALRDKIPGS